MSEAVEKSATKGVNQMRYRHMLDRLDPNDRTVMISALALTLAVWQGVDDALNTAGEVLLRHPRLAKHPPRQYAR